MSAPSKKPKRSTKTISRASTPSRASPRSKPYVAPGSGPPLFEEWSAFLRALLSTGARFMLVGGHAVAIHAEPRLTEDLDVFIDASIENAPRVRAALELFGFGDVAPPEASFTVPQQVFMLGRKPRRIDILTSIDGVSFAAAWRTHVEVRMGNSVVPIIGKRQLILNKRAAARPKDLADLALLEHAPRSPRKR